MKGQNACEFGRFPHGNCERHRRLFPYSRDKKIPEWDWEDVKMGERTDVHIFEDDLDVLNMLTLMIRLEGYTVIPHPDYNFRMTQEIADKTLIAVLDANCPPCDGPGYLNLYGHLLTPDRRCLSSGDMKNWEKTGYEGFPYTKGQDSNSVLIDIIRTAEQKAR